MALIHFIPPSLVLSVVVALIIATLWFAWRGGRPRDWVFDILAAMVGFGLGQLAGAVLGWTLFQVGEVRVLLGTLSALVTLWLVRRARRPQQA